MKSRNFKVDAIISVAIILRVLEVIVRRFSRDY